MNQEIPVGLFAGIIFGFGLALSDMVNPARVRAFLDIFGNWDPTLALVMVGAILPMAFAWAWRQKMDKPIIGSTFALPGTTNIDPKLAMGAVLFGIGWGISGLCPGPALAGIALSPRLALIFVIFMLLGMLLARFVTDRKSS